jgi:hypothetical protein
MTPQITPLEIAVALVGLMWIGVWSGRVWSRRPAVKPYRTRSTGFRLGCELMLFGLMLAGLAWAVVMFARGT